MTAGPIALVILDGWGIAPPSRGNAVTLAKTPNLNRWKSTYPWTEVQAGGQAVGLMPDQDGNSEAGHMNIGAGRIVLQENVRISASINDGTFFRNPAFLSAIHHVRRHKSTLHLMGMLGSNQSAHADPDHLLALLMLTSSSQLRDVKLHLFTDGRDSPRYYAREMLTRFVPHFGDARVATIMGRFYAMDRNKNWDRTAQAYAAMTAGRAEYTAADPLEAVAHAYNRGESDEFISPTVMNGYRGMHDHDAIIFFNLRSDRARQLAKTFVQENFEAANATAHPFTRPKKLNTRFVAMTDFGPDLGEILTAYPAETLTQTLTMTIGDLKQLYIAESEKYAHVTYFFNGGYAEPVAGEARVLIPSGAAKHFDALPAMQTPVITERVVTALNGGAHNFIVANFANTDMVAHTGNLPAGIQAMEIADACLGKIVDAAQAVGGTVIITGDHGNLEEMINVSTNEIDTEHSANPVPVMVISENVKGRKLRTNGVLGDIAPTILSLFRRPQPPAMTGRSLWLA